MAKQLKLYTQPGPQRFDCSGCGECCRGRFGINVSDEDRARIESQNWSGDDLLLGGRPLFIKRSDGDYLAHRADGSCVFLTDDNRCRIHGKFGGDAKPIACRLYPFKLIPAGNQVRVDVRFDCPSVASNIGAPIATHRDELQKLLQTIVAGRDQNRPAPTLYGRHAMTWPKLIRITETFERVLWDASLDLTRRVTACVNLAAVLRDPRVGGLEAKALDGYLDEAASGVQQAAAIDTLQRRSPHALERAIFRQMIGMHAQHHHVGGRNTIFTRLRTSMRMIRGRGTVPLLRDEFPRVSFSDMDSETGVPTGETSSALERYLHIHLISMGFCGAAFYGRSYLDGINSLLLTYPIICWFARAYAAEAGLSAPNTKCVERALRIVDHQYGLNPSMNMQGAQSRTNFLHERAALRSLVIWYGS